MRRFLIITGLAALALIIAWSAKTLLAPKPWNVLLVTFDTTRADRLQSYGNSRIKTPTLNQLAQDGVQFNSAFSAAPITAPSHSTIHTGLYPLAHGFRDNGLFVLGDEHLTLAEILKSNGYATAASIGAYPLISKFGLNQGFDLYDDHLTGHVEDYLGQRAVPKERLFFDERRAAQVNEAIEPWLSEHAGRPFFAWVHYFDPHQPFEPPPPFDQEYADDLYDGEIAYSDSRLGRLLQHLDALGELDRTLIVMTADHGEGLGEHNEETHAVLAYDTTLHVPLIIRAPRDSGLLRGQQIDQHVGNIDVLPTILDLLGIDIPEAVQGRSLRPLMEGQSIAAREYYAENLSPHLSHGWGKLRVLYSGDHKYIHGPEPELYNTRIDPKELSNLINSEPSLADELHEALSVFIFDHAVGQSKTAAVDDETLRRLQSLGYLQGGASDVQTISEALEKGGFSPHQGAPLLNSMSSAKHLLFKGHFEAALPYTEQLITVDPESPMYIELHASALAGSGQLDEAWRMLQKQLDKGSVTEHFALSLSGRKFAAGDRVDAIQFLQKYSQFTNSARAYWQLSLFERLEHQDERYVESLKYALEADANFAPARVNLAVWQAGNGQTEEAQDNFKKALKDQPYYAKGHFNYAVYLLGIDQAEDALLHFQRAATLLTGYLAAYRAVVITALSLDQDALAQQYLAKLKQIAPDSEVLSELQDLLHEQETN